MKTLYFSTPYGKSYNVNEQGQIYRAGVKPSDDWKLIGIGPVDDDWFIRFEDLTPDRIKRLELLDRHGDPAYTVHDLDHGTHRMWGNTRYHGISYMAFVEVKE